MASVEVRKKSYCPIHRAVLTKDHATLSSHLSSLPPLSEPSKIQSEADSIEEEKKADAISAVIDCQDCSGGDTPLHLAVKLGDDSSTEILMSAGADCSLQNEKGWNALQEAICSGKRSIVNIIVRHHQTLDLAKWCRGLPRLIATMNRMRNFYTEIEFHSDGSLIPFIPRIAPSNVFKIWKMGSNLRADMTLANSGLDTSKIQRRSDQSVLFFGDGSTDGKIPGGSLFLVSHQDKEVMNALEGAGHPATEASAMSQTHIFHRGIDVTQAALVSRDGSEMVGQWESTVYDMDPLVFSEKSRPVPRALPDEAAVISKRLPEAALVRSTENTVNPGYRCGKERGKPTKDKIKWFCCCGRKGKHRRKNSSFCCSSDSTRRRQSGEITRTYARDCSKSHGTGDSEYRKVVKPTLWLSPDFPLETGELLLLLDILANKVTYVRLLRELLTAKLPQGTFPVKVEIPVTPGDKLRVEFTKFVDLHDYDPFLIPSDYTWKTLEAREKRMQECESKPNKVWELNPSRSLKYLTQR